MGNIFKKVFGKGGAIDKATRWADKKTGGATGKLFKGVEGIVKGIPVVGGVYGAAKGVGGAMLKIASGEAKAENKAKTEVAEALKSTKKSVDINYEVTVSKDRNFFGKIKQWFMGLPAWLRWGMMAIPFLLFLVFILIRRRKPTRRRTVRRSTPKAAARRRRSTGGKTKSAFVKRMQAGKRKAASKRKRG